MFPSPGNEDNSATQQYRPIFKENPHSLWLHKSDGKHWGIHARPVGGTVTTTANADTSQI